MQSGPKFKTMSVDMKNASAAQQQLFKNVGQFFDAKTSELMQLLSQRIFMTKDIKIDVKFESNIKRAILEKTPGKPQYQLSLSSNARAIDTLFDLIHALYDIDSRTFDQKSKDNSVLEHRFNNAYKKTFEAMAQMFYKASPRGTEESTQDSDYAASLGIDKADLEHLRNAIPGQTHKTTTLKNSVAKDFALKTVKEEEAEYIKVSKDESGTNKVTVFTKKPEYSINALPKVAAAPAAEKKSTPPVAELKAQAQASKSQVFVDKETGTICCSICASSGTFSIVTKIGEGYYCDRGGPISASAVLEAAKFGGNLIASDDRLVMDPVVEAPKAAAAVLPVLPISTPVVTAKEVKIPAKRPVQPITTAAATTQRPIEVISPVASAPATVQRPVEVLSQIITSSVRDMFDAAEEENSDFFVSSAPVNATIPVQVQKPVEVPKEIPAAVVAVQASDDFFGASDESDFLGSGPTPKAITPMAERQANISRSSPVAENQDPNKNFDFDAPDSNGPSF